MFSKTRSSDDIRLDLSNERRLLRSSPQLGLRKSLISQQRTNFVFRHFHFSTASYRGLAVIFNATVKYTIHMDRVRRRPQFESKRKKSEQVKTKKKHSMLDHGAGNKGPFGPTCCRSDFSGFISLGSVV